MQDQMLSGPIVFSREVQPADRDRVRELTTSAGVFSPVEIEVAVELLEERLSKGPLSGYFFIFAVRDERTLGYACYGPISLTAASYDLYWIVVDKTCQGQKIGKALMAESEKLVRAAGGRKIYIETSNRNQYAPTRKFYLRCGYRQEALLKDFYAPGDDKVIYAKSLIGD
ncbi:MAG TPA: GNAT family N-acetyltransferase [Thermoguttaceae bacterium]